MHTLLLFLATLPLTQGVASILDNSLRLMEFRKTYPSSVVGLFSSSSSSLTSFDNVHEKIFFELQISLGFAIVVDTALQQDNFIATDNVADDDDNDDKGEGVDVATPSATSTLVAHVRFQQDGSLLPAEETSRIVRKSYNLDQLSSKKKMKHMLDFVYAHTLPPVIEYPGGREDTTEGRWGRFAMNCVWPKIIVPYASKLTKEMETLLIELGKEYVYSLYFTIIYC